MRYKKLKIDENVEATLHEFCEKRGLKIGRFVENAILDKIEEVEDVSDIQELRREPLRALDDILRDLKAGGKI